MASTENVGSQHIAVGSALLAAPPALPQRPNRGIALLSDSSTSNTRANSENSAASNRAGAVASAMTALFSQNSRSHVPSASVTSSSSSSSSSDGDGDGDGDKVHVLDDIDKRNGAPHDDCARNNNRGSSTYSGGYAVGRRVRFVRPGSPVDFAADTALQRRGAEALARSISLLQAIADTAVAKAARAATDNGAETAVDAEADDEEAEDEEGDYGADACDGVVVEKSSLYDSIQPAKAYVSDHEDDDYGYEDRAHYQTTATNLEAFSGDDDRAQYAAERLDYMQAGLAANTGDAGIDLVYENSNDKEIAGPFSSLFT